MATAISAARLALDKATTGAITIPFDYAFRFELTGVPQQAHRTTVKVSGDGAFVAVSIGYGFVPAVERKVFGFVPAARLTAGGATAAVRPLTLAGISLADLLASVQAAVLLSRSPSSRERLVAALRTGFRLNPEVAERVLTTPGALLDITTLSRLFEIGGTSGNIQFMYALTDEGTGRELQSEPILSTAGLGAADGDRPFRQFPMPVRFEPSSSIRMDVTEVEREPGRLHVVLHGYRVLGTPAPSAGAASPVAQRRRRR
jgi:hypothetical protein